MKAIKDRLTGIILTILSVLLTVGVKSFFSACAPKEDGSWMNCHWAEQAVFVMGCALTAMAVFVLISGKSEAGAGAALSMTALSAAAALTPGLAINLCMMTTMHCHTVMRPAVIVICALIAVTGAAHTFLTLKGGKKK